MRKESNKIIELTSSILRNPGRAAELLRAAHDLLTVCNQDGFINNPATVRAYYSGEFHTGTELLKDIRTFFDISPAGKFLSELIESPSPVSDIYCNECGKVTRHEFYLRSMIHMCLLCGNKKPAM